MTRSFRPCRRLLRPRVPATACPEQLDATAKADPASDRSPSPIDLPNSSGIEGSLRRKLTATDHLDALNEALDEITNEETELRTRLASLDERAHLQARHESVERQLGRLADTARAALASPTRQLMAEVFDLLQIDLGRVAGDHFEGTGSIPIPAAGKEILSGVAGDGGARDGGEVLTGAPQRSNSSGSTLLVRWVTAWWWSPFGPGAPARSRSSASIDVIRNRCRAET